MAQRQSRDGKPSERRKLHLAIQLAVMRINVTSDRGFESPTELMSRVHVFPTSVQLEPTLTDLPFSWTFAENAVFFALGGLKLHLVRSSIIVDPAHSDKNPAECEGTGAEEPERVTLGPFASPSETVFLPQSATERSVDFYPPTRWQKRSTLVIGPRYRVTRHSGPIVVYLEDRHLGDWREAGRQ